MANVTRFDPRADYFGDLVDDLFKGFLVRPMYSEGREPLARVVQATKDGRLRAANDFRNIFTTESLEFEQHEHDSFCFRELPDRLGELPAGLPFLERFGTRLCRNRQPVGQQGPNPRTAPSDSRVTRANSIQPGPEIRLMAKARQVLEYVAEHLLAGILQLARRDAQSSQHRQRILVVAQMQAPPRSRVPRNTAVQ